MPPELRRRYYKRAIPFVIGVVLVGITNAVMPFWLGFYEPPPLTPILIAVGSLIIYWITLIRFMNILPSLAKLDEQQQQLLWVLKLAAFMLSIYLTWIVLQSLWLGFGR